MSNIMTSKSGNTRYGLSYSQDIWDDEPFDKMGSVRVDCN